MISPQQGVHAPYVVSYITGSGLANRKSNGLRLPPGRARVMQMHYTAPTFVAAEQARFKYQLEPPGLWHTFLCSLRVLLRLSLWSGLI